MSIIQKFWLWLGTKYWKGIDLKMDKTHEFVIGITFSNSKEYLKEVSEIEID